MIWHTEIESAVPVSSPINLATLVFRKPNLVEADLDSEIVALNIDTGNCYGLNAVGSEIWRLLASPVVVGAICAQLIEEYSVEATTCESQVLALLEDLRAEGLIDARDQ